MAELSFTTLGYDTPREAPCGLHTPPHAFKDSDNRANQETPALETNFDVLETHGQQEHRRLYTMAGRHHFEYINLSGGTHHLGDRNASYNLFNLAAPAGRPGTGDLKFERHLLETSDPNAELLHFRMRRGVRVRGTCAWMWEAGVVRTWLRQRNCSILFITGHAGTGKTEAALFLLDTIAEQTMHGAQNPDLCTAHFFCSTKDARFLTERHILRSLLYQLCRRKEFLRYVEEAFEQFCFPRGGLLDDFEALWLVLIAILQDQAATNIVLILDAIDSCPQPTRVSLFRHLEDLQNKSRSRRISVHILITCRNLASVPRSLRELGRHLCLEGNSLRQDLELYVSVRVAELAESMAYPDHVRQDLVRALRRRNGGTFLWLAIVLQHLKSTQTRAADVIDRLEELPKDLVGLYDQIFARVSAEAIPHVRLLLQLLCVARREVTKDDILLAYCLDQQSWTDDRMPEFREYEHIILDRTDLVVFDSRRQTLNFLHDTVVEYLTDSLATPQPWYHFGLGAQMHLLQAAAVPTLLDAGMGPLLLSNGLARLVFHVDSERAHYLCFCTSFKTLGLRAPSNDDKWCRSQSLREYSKEFLQVHASASWSLLRAEFPWADISWAENSERGELWLSQAARLDSRCLAALLDVNMHAALSVNSLLAAAAESGNVQSMEVLLSNGAQVDPECPSPLQLAAQNYHVEAVNYLITHGADVDRKVEESESLLLSMLGSPSETVTCLDVEVQGNDMLVASNVHYSTSWDFLGAAYFNTPGKRPSRAYEDVVLSLILASVDLEAADGLSRTPLMRAAQNRQWRFVKRLIELGANVDSIGSQGMTPLLLAIQPPRRTAAFKNVTARHRALAFLGGLVIQRSVMGQQPSDEAEFSDQWACAIHALIDRTSDLDTADGDGRSAVALAAESGEAWIVEALLAKGVSINSTDADGYTPLMQACRLPRFWNVTVDNLNVYDEASVYAGGILIQSPESDSRGYVRETSAAGRLATVRVLLENNANPNRMSGDGDTALSLAITDNLQDVVDLLLANGAFNAPFDRTREAMLQRFSCIQAGCHGSSRLHLSGSGGHFQMNGFVSEDESRVHAGIYCSLGMPGDTFYTALAKVAPLCPATLFQNVHIYDQAKVLLGIEDVAFLNVNDAQNFDSALACPIPFRDVKVRDRARWHFAIDILPDWNPRCRPRAGDFFSLPRCHFHRVKIADRGKLELGNTVLVEHENVVFAVTSQYPGNSFENIRVNHRGRLRTSAFTAGSANGVVLRVYEMLKEMYLQESGEAG